MIKPHLAIAAVACLVLLQGCGPLLVRDETVGAYTAARSGVFELHEDITIRAGRTRTYLQDGAIVSGVNEFRPHCQLEINTLSESPQTVRVDRFSITRIGTRTDQVVQSAPLQLAALDGTARWPFDGFMDGELRRMYVYIFHLHSDQQPDVRALICGGAFDSPGLAVLPSLGEIARALGRYGSLQLR
ncbi:MAG: hypothetical protein ACLGH6_08190 [Gammaproteobacteria bacterium]